MLLYNKMAQHTELIIETVKTYPVLYDTSHCDYKNNRTKNKIWDNISEIVGDSDGDTIKTKWKNLRDAYIKHLRSKETQTGQTAKFVGRYNTWPWVEQMSFLRPYLEFASTHSNIQSDTEEAGSTLQTRTHTSKRQHNLRKRAADQKESEVDKVINFLNNRQTEHDETDLIFLGYSRTIKHMSKRRQATVKFQVAKIIMDAELEQFEESSPTIDTRSIQSTENRRGTKVSRK